MHPAFRLIRNVDSCQSVGWSRRSFFGRVRRSESTKSMGNKFAKRFVAPQLARVCANLIHWISMFSQVGLNNMNATAPPCSASDNKAEYAGAAAHHRPLHTPKHNRQTDQFYSSHRGVAGWTMRRSDEILIKLNNEFYVIKISNSMDSITTMRDRWRGVSQPAHGFRPCCKFQLFSRSQTRIRNNNINEAPFLLNGTRKCAATHQHSRMHTRKVPVWMESRKNENW